MNATTSRQIPTFNSLDKIVSYLKITSSEVLEKLQGLFDKVQIGSMTQVQTEYIDKNAGLIHLIRFDNVGGPVVVQTLPAPLPWEDQAYLIKYLGEQKVSAEVELVELLSVAVALRQDPGGTVQFSMGGPEFRMLVRDNRLVIEPNVLPD